MDASVVICTRNRAALVRRLLGSLAGQRAKADWEVLVVANDCSDDTAPSIAALARGFPVPLRVEEEARRGLARARNRGIDATAGALLLFLDDDATCRPGWLAAHLAAFEAPEVAGTGGRIVPVLPPGAPAWFVAESTQRLGGPASRYDFGDLPAEVGAGTRHPPPFGANMGVRRAALADSLHFRTDLGWGRQMVVGEDTDLMRRLAARGGRLLYVPAAIVDHHIGPERCNRDYFTRWYRGFGRASIRYEPPATAAARLALAAVAGRQFVSAWLRTVPDRVRRGGRNYSRSLRRSATARGQLEELLS